MASCSAAHLEAPTEQSVAKDLPVHGLGGRQQVTTMLSVPIVMAPFDAADSHQFVGALRTT